MTFWTGRTVLVTGASGFVGRHVVRRLTRDGACVAALARRGRDTLPAEAPGSVVWLEAALEKLTPERFAAWGLDSLDTVFHLGAYVARSTGQGDAIAEIYASNLLGTRALLTSLPNVRGRLILASTADVYASSARPLRETSALGPASLYAASKVVCEHVARVVADRRGLPLTILRYGVLYGPGEERHGKLIPATINRVLGGQPPVLIGSGEERRDFLYIDDAVEATLRAASPGLQTPLCLNVARGRAIRTRVVQQLLLQLLAYTGPLERAPAVAPAPDRTFNNSCMLAALGRWPFVPLAKGLAEEVRHAREHQARMPQAARS